MTSKRMFSLDIVDTDKFLDMPATTQALYFHLGMRADDDGFIHSPRKIVKIVGCGNDDFKLLVSKGYLIPFESGVVVITDWKINNWIRPDRKHDTRCKHELSLLTVIDGKYEPALQCLPNDSQMSTACHTEIRLDKNSIRLDKNSKDIYGPELLDKTLDQPLSGIKIILNDKTYYDVPLDKIAIWKESFPAVNIEAELKKMVAWSENNPQKRKTRKGVARFINNWLSREQDKGRYQPINQRQQDKERESQENKEAMRIAFEKQMEKFKDLPDVDGPF